MGNITTSVEFQDALSSKSEHLSPKFCIMKEQSYGICMNKECQEEPFRCMNLSCKCKLQHSECYMVETSTLFKNLSINIVSLQPLENLIDREIDIMVDQLQNFRDNIIQEIRDRLEFFGLTYEQKEVYKALISSDKREITGSKVWQAYWGLGSQKKNENQSEVLNNKVKTVLESLNKHILNICANIENEIKEAQPKQKNVSQQYKISQKDVSPFVKLLQSKIAYSNKQRETLESFFEQRKIDSVKLLYRASEHEFCAQKFHKLCDGVEDTLTLCKTEFNKKIGGYTPIPWQQQSARQSNPDPKGLSFLFSLTNRDKFELFDQSDATYHQSQLEGPNFGRGSDLVIANKANTNTSSYAKPNSSYMNPKYGDFQNGIKRFSGNAHGDKCFKVKEWEVWSVVFSKDQPQELFIWESDSQEDCSKDRPDDSLDNRYRNTGFFQFILKNARSDDDVPRM